MNPIILLTIVALMGLAFTLTIAVWRTLARPVEIEDFEQVLSRVTGSETPEVDTTLLRTAKKKSWTWQGWWYDAAIAAGRTPSDPGGPGRVMLGAAVVMAFFGVVVFPGGMAGMYVGIVAVAAGRLLLSFEASKRKLALEMQMPLLLSGLRSEMHSGTTVQKAIMNVSANLPSPIGDEMRTVRDDVNVNVPLEKALEGLAERINSRLMQFLVSSIGVAIKSGSDLVPQLVTIEEIVRQRARIDGKIRSAIALARPTALLAEGAPPLVFGYFVITDPTYLPFWFTRGLIMFGVAVVLYGLGVFLLQLMVKNVEKI